MKIEIIGILAGIINGLFGSGSGMVILPALLSNKQDEVTARGTTIMSVLFLSIISSIFYLKNSNNSIDLNAIWYVVAGGIIGGTLGSKLIKKVPVKYLQILSGVFMVYTGITMFIK